MPNHTPKLTPELLAKIREYADNDLPIGSTTAKEWLRAQAAALKVARESLDSIMDYSSDLAARLAAKDALRRIGHA